MHQIRPFRQTTRLTRPVKNRGGNVFRLREIWLNLVIKKYCFLKSERDNIYLAFLNVVQILLLLIQKNMNNSKPAFPVSLEAKIATKQMLMYFLIGLTGFVVLWLFAPIKTFYLIVMGLALVVAGFYVVKNLMDTSPTVVINARGVFDKRLTAGIMLWKDIKRVYCVSIDNIDYVCLDLHNEEKYLSRNAAVGNLLIKANSSMTGISRFNINTGILDVDAEEIYQAITRGCEFSQNK